MKNDQNQDKRNVRLKKTFSIMSLIMNALLFIGGIVMLSFLILLFVRIGEWANIGF